MHSDAALGQVLGQVFDHVVAILNGDGRARYELMMPPYRERPAAYSNGRIGGRNGYGARVSWRLLSAQQELGREMTLRANVGKHGPPVFGDHGARLSLEYDERVRGRRGGGRRVLLY